MSSQTDNGVIVALILAGMFFVFVIGGVWGTHTENKRMKAEAVKMGAATWTNDAYGNVKFHWTVGI
jgi:hypothetical protein